jgi:hypothetical protein
LSEWTKWSRGVLSFFCDSRMSRKRSSITNLLRCSRRMPSHTRVWQDSILSGGYFGSGFRRCLVIAQRWWPRCSEWSNYADFLRWTLFFCIFCIFCTTDSPQDMCSKKLDKLYIVGLSIVDISQSDIGHRTSDIFIGFLTSSPTVRRQVKSSRVESSYRSNFVTCCCPSGIKDKMEIYIIVINPWQVSHGFICRQIMRWSDFQMEMRSPIERSTWFRARDWCYRSSGIHMDSKLLILCYAMLCYAKLF